MSCGEGEGWRNVSVVVRGGFADEFDKLQAEECKVEC